MVWQFKEVLDRLLDTVTQSIQQALCQEEVTHSPQLVTNCCHLLAKVVAELAAQARGIDVSYTDRLFSVIGKYDCGDFYFIITHVSKHSKIR